jgi:transcription initiation factor IIE alpha subunit
MLARVDTADPHETSDMQAILDYLKNTGEKLDSEIAAATGLSLANVRNGVNDLHARGAIMVCKSIRYQDGKEIDGILCRISGYIPQAAPGRKPKSHAPAKTSNETPD